MDTRSEADGVEIPEGNNDLPRGPGGGDTAGVKERGMRTHGSPRNLGGPTVSTNKKKPAGAGRPNPRPLEGSAPPTRGIEARGGAEVEPPCEATSTCGDEGNRSTP